MSKTASIPAAARAQLAPTGKLRAGLNFQNVLLTKLGPGGEPAGVAVEFAREIARRLAVPLEIVPYQSAASLANSVAGDAWDICVLAHEPERAELIEFAPPLTEIDATYLVPQRSRIATIADIDRPGIRIVSPAKTAYDLYLTRTIKNAELLHIPEPQSTECFLKGNLDALAGLRPVLLEIAPTIAGSRILDGNFTVVRHSVGIPKGRDTASAYMRDLVYDIKASCLIDEWIEKNGVKGVRKAT
jgi:polar amino acid transport system substrate-binding protein